MSGSSEGQKKSAMFSRQATGLVRQASFWDTFFFNSSAAWYVSLFILAIGDLYWVPGGDYVTATVIGTVLAIFIGLSYAGLTSIMPRSGGDYVFNSRILHPSVGFGFNFSLTFWELFTAAFSLYYIPVFYLGPGLGALGYLSNNGAITNFSNTLFTSTNVLIIGTLFNIFFLVLALLGTKATLRFINVTWIFATLSVLLTIGVLLATSHSSFVSIFDKTMASFGGPLSNGTSAYQAVITTAKSQGFTIPPNVVSLPAIAIIAGGVIWTFWSTYISGEVKRAGDYKRNIGMMVGSCVMNGVLMIIVFALLYRTFGYDFLGSVSWLTTSSPTSLPFGSASSFAFLTALASQNSIVVLILVIGFVLGGLIVMPALIYQPVRSMFAWSMDRVIPSKFSSVSERFHVPVLLHVVAFVIIEVVMILFDYSATQAFAVFAAAIIAPAFSSMFPAGISALLVPFRKKSAFDASSANGKIGGIPLLSIFGLICAAYISFLLYEFIAWPEFGITSINVTLTALGVLIGGFVLYFIIREIQKRRGVDFALIMSEIPPE
jgi:amino acid transporter